MKGQNKGRVLQQLPREGTEIRRAYDLLYANKGTPVKISFGWHSRLENLRNIYGLDIVKTRKGEWCLIGEWFGKVYIDYVAEKVSKE